MGVGDRCIVSIRPEHIEMVGDLSGTTSNTFSGLVEARLFTGESMVYRVRLAEGALSCRTSADLRFSTGKPVSLHLPTSHAIALPPRGVEAAATTA